MHNGTENKIKKHNTNVGGFDDMKTISYTPRGVCSRQIDVTVDGDTVVSVKFTGGCPGNTQGVAALIGGMNIDEAISRLDGIRCGNKPTSCPDQLAKALRMVKENNG